LAGLPKAPSSYNPIANPQRAKIRRNWVLERMYKLGYIDQMAYQQAIKVPVSARFHGPKGVVRAPYIAEMARTDLLEALGPDIYTHGYRVYTSIDSKLQQAANQALRQGLLDYSRRHGYRGPEHHLTTQDRQQWLAYLQQLTSENGLIPAVVSSVQSKSISALLADNQTTSIPWSGLSWARRYLTANRMGHKPRQASNIVKVGDVIRVQQDNQGNWQLAQVPKVQGALVSLNPNNGAIQALVGGFNFFDSHYNRAVQALRQPGSNFKPFVYAAALDQGFTPASLINDAPIVLDDQLVTRWRPRNEGGRFLGPTRLRLGLVQSRNLMSIRLMQALGIEPTINYIQRFGFTQEQLPKSLTLALGSGSTSPLDIAAGYAVFANGGYRIWPYVISSITDDAGHILYENQSPKVCKHCPQLQPGDPLFTLAGSNGREERLTSITFSQSRANQHQQPIAPQVLSPSTAYLMNSMLRDVIQWGTGRKAKVLNRFDIAGKTGTTNDQVDAWFSGFNTDLVTSVWVGFDQPQTLGRHEFGARAALPIWIDYMKVALADKAVKPFTPPEEVVAVRIDPKTGLRAYPRQKNAIVEFFPKDQEPAVTAMDPKNSVQSDYSLEHIF
jgi:penicillin-binding protein 1A